MMEDFRRKGPMTEIIGRLGRLESFMQEAKRLWGSGGSLSVSNANNIYQVSSPGGISAWAGTFVTVGSSGTTIKYSTTSGNAASMKPTSISQLAKMVLYNTTRGNSVYILDWVAGTITSTANYPANWTNGDVLTIASQTVSGGGLSWVDLVITSGDFVGKSTIWINTQIVSANVGDLARLHPFDAIFSGSKYIPMDTSVANMNSNGGSWIFKLISNTICLAWTGTPTSVLIRESGYVP